MGSVLPADSRQNGDSSHQAQVTPQASVDGGAGEGGSAPPTTTTSSQEEHPDSAPLPQEESDSEDEGSTEGDGEDGKVLSAERPPESATEEEGGGDKTTPPLTEYIINVVHFLDAILSNNSTDDHMREFISQGGMQPLLQLLSLPTLPLDFPTSAACTAITGACRNIMVSMHLRIYTVEPSLWWPPLVVAFRGEALSQEFCFVADVIETIIVLCLLPQHISHSPELLTTSLTQLSSLLTELQPFLSSPQNASNSILLQEIGPLSNMTQAINCPTITPVLHKLVAVNAFIQLFVFLSRSCQAGYNVRLTTHINCPHSYVGLGLGLGLGLRAKG